MAESSELHHHIARVNQLIEGIEASEDTPLRETTRELLATVLEMHGLCIRKMLEFANARDAAGISDGSTLQAWLGDDLIRHVLTLHSLHPVDRETRVQEALQRVRPHLQSHGGDVALVAIDESGVTKLRVSGACSVLSNLRDTIEQALCETAPDVPAIHYEGLRNDDKDDQETNIHLSISDNKPQ